MQRLHEEDLVGHLLAEGGWHELRLPLVAETEQDVPLGGNRVQHRTVGTPSTLSRVPLEIVQKSAEPWALSSTARSISRTRNRPRVVATAWQREPIRRAPSQL